MKFAFVVPLGFIMVGVLIAITSGLTPKLNSGTTSTVHGSFRGAAPSAAGMFVESVNEQDWTFSVKAENKPATSKVIKAACKFICVKWRFER